MDLSHTCARAQSEGVAVFLNPLSQGHWPVFCAPLRDTS